MSASPMHERYEIVDDPLFNGWIMAVSKRCMWPQQCAPVNAIY